MPREGLKVLEVEQLEVLVMVLMEEGQLLVKQASVVLDQEEEVEIQDLLLSLLESEQVVLPEKVVGELLLFSQLEEREARLLTVREVLVVKEN
jgi:hypothetical protein